MSPYGYTGTEPNIAIGYKAAQDITKYGYNLVIGKDALEEGEGKNSVIIGMEAAQNASGVAESNVVIGNVAGKHLAGNNNVLIGAGAGESLTGSGNVFIGSFAGNSLTTTSDTLYISNTYEATEPLIFGVFPNSELGFNASKIGFNKKTPVSLIAESLSTGSLGTPTEGKYGFATKAEAEAAFKFIEKFSLWAHEAGLTA